MLRFHLLLVLAIAGCGRLRVEESGRTADASPPASEPARRPASVPGLDSTADQPAATEPVAAEDFARAHADREAACELARPALSVDAEPRVLHRALTVLPCDPDDASALATLWAYVPADTALLVPLVAASRRTGGPAPLEAGLAQVGSFSRPAGVRLAALALLAGYLDPETIVDPPDTVTLASERRVPPGTIYRAQGAVPLPMIAQPEGAATTVIDAIGVVARRDPNAGVRRLAEQLRRQLAARMLTPEWRESDRARSTAASVGASGCFLLRLFNWPSDTLPGYTQLFSPPPLFELDSARNTTEAVPGARVLRPSVAGAKATWWVLGTDSVAVRWATADAGLMLRMKVLPKELYGRATAYTAPGGPELRTMVLATRVACER
jgi:hypothetical protein